MWGSEIQRVLSQSPEVVEDLENYVEKQCQELAYVLVLFLPHFQRADFNIQGLRDIFKEASELAHQICLSPQPYAFEIAFHCSDPDPRRVLIETERTKYRIINAATCQPLRESDIVTVSPKGRVGKKLCVIHPALTRRGENEKENTILTKATILASLDYPIGRPKPKQETRPNVEVKIEGQGEEPKQSGGWFNSWKR
jgi:hypothetical protein